MHLVWFDISSLIFSVVPDAAAFSFRPRTCVLACSETWPEKLESAFRICRSGVKEDTYMCYSEFTDIITIETSRSGMELLDTFTNLDYPNEIGPEAYDIHSPNIPGVD